MWDVCIHFLEIKAVVRAVKQKSPAAVSSLTIGACGAIIPLWLVIANLRQSAIPLKHKNVKEDVLCWNS